MGLRAKKGGGFVKDLQAKLRTFPLTVAQEIAGQAAPALTDMAQGSFDSGRNVYGDARPPGVDGQPLTLRKSGDAEAAVAFAATGTQVRTPIFPKYFRYLIARYGVMPNGRAAIPAAWKEKLNEITHKAKGPV